MKALWEMSSKIPHLLDKYSNWLDAIMLLCLIVYIMSGISLVPFHGDEATYIWLSQDYDILVNQKDRSPFLWDPNSEADVMKQGFHFATGSIFGFSIALARDLTGIGKIVNNRWIWGYSWNENVQNGSMPNHSLLILARATAATMGALSVVFLFLGARQLFDSRLAGWTATLLYASHGGMLVGFRRAMQEGPKFLFLLISLYFTVRLIKNLQTGQLRRDLYLWLGLASGMTLAAKLDIAAVLAAIYFALALIPICNKDRAQHILGNVLYVVAAAIIAFASFLAFMPVLWAWWDTVLMLSGLALLAFQIPVWNDGKSAKLMALAGCMIMIGMTILSPSLWKRIYIPMERIADVRQRAMNAQINIGLPPLYGINRKVTFFLTNTMTTDVMYKEMLDFGGGQLNEQISEYEASPVHGRIGSPFMDTFVIVLFFLGCWALSGNFGAESLFLFSLFIIPALFLLFFVPLPWQRYFLIMQIPYSLIAGAGMEYAASMLREEVMNDPQVDSGK